MELETVVEEDESCSSEKSIEARLSISNPKRSGQNGERRTCEEASRVACCIHSVTPKQPHAVHNQSDALSQEGDRGYRKPSPPSTSRCCGRENEHSRSSDEENGMNDLGSSSSSKSNQVCVMNCNEVVQVDESDGSSPHGSFRSDDGGGDRALEAVGAPGTFGEIKVNNSSDVHFGNKIYTAPITVVNQVGGDDPDLVVDSGSFKGKWIGARLWHRGISLRLQRASRCHIVIIIFVVALLACVSPLAALFSRANKSAGGSDIRDTEDPIPLEPGWLIRRRQWLAAKPKHVKRLSKPQEVVVISQTATERCHNRDTCGTVVRTIQEKHMQVDNYDDIGYNFLVGGDGRVYEGVGWGVKGSHMFTCDAECLGVAFIGDYRSKYSNSKPTANQVKYLNRLLDIGEENGNLTTNYSIIPDSQTRVPERPGDNLLRVIVTWPRYSASNESLI